MIVKLRKEKNAEMKLILISEIFKDNKKVDKLAKNEIHTRIDTQIGIPISEFRNLCKIAAFKK